jgi:hypothetical protein
VNIARKTSLLIAVVLGLFVGSARADDGMLVRVPISFLVDGRLMQAGQYSISRPVSGSLLVRRLGAIRTATFTQTMALGSQNPTGAVPSIVLKKYENQYRLVEVWVDRTTGFSPYSSMSTSSDPSLAAAETLILTIAR